MATCTATCMVTFDAKATRRARLACASFALWGLLACLVLAAPLPLASRAHAQTRARGSQPLAEGSTVAILPGGDLVRDRREGEVRASLLTGLKKLGYRALDPNQVRTQLTRAGNPELCLTPAGCDYKALLAALDADAVVVYSLWLEDDEPSEFAIGITRPGARGDASHRMARGDGLADVVPRVFMQALKTATGAGTIRVRIETDPAGAEIEVDRELTGTSPVVFELAPGQHEIRATADGRVALLDYVDVEEGQGEQLVALVLAEPEPTVIDDAPVDLEYRAPNHTLDYVLGGVLAALAAGAATYGVLTFKDEGKSCFTADLDFNNRCVVVASPPPLTVASLAAAGVLATGSVLLFALTPFTNDSGDVAGLQLHGQF